MENKPTIIAVVAYKGKFITKYSDGSATVSGMKYENTGRAKAAIDKILLLSKKEIGIFNEPLPIISLTIKQERDRYKEGLEMIESYGHEFYSPLARSILTY